MDNFEEYLEKLNEEKEPNEVYYDIIDVGLPTYVLFDTSNRHKYDNTPICIYVMDGYLDHSGVVRFDLDTFKFDKKINLTHIDQKKIENFCRKNKQNICDLANEKISYNEFKDLVKNSNINESEVLNEKFILDPKETGLNRKIWVDNGEIALKRSKHNFLRIKIETPKGENDSNKWSSIFLTPEIKFCDKHKFDINDREKLFIKKFIEKNYNQFISASTGNCNDKETFVKLISKIKKNGDFILPEIRDDYYVVDELSNVNLKKVKSENNLFNYVDESGNLISDVWFTSASTFFKINGKYVAHVETVGCDGYLIDVNGEKVEAYF